MLYTPNIQNFLLASKLFICDKKYSVAMGKIEVKRRAPRVFTNERDIVSSVIGDGASVKNSLKQLAEYPDFGACVYVGGKPIQETIDDGPFDPNAKVCGIRDYDEADYNDDFLICGQELSGDGEGAVMICDFNFAFNNSFFTCRGNSEACKPIKKK